tara:strand:+ start:42988 stop:44556 length:1569 start_codon:yes stop_codon:yes gene_type:complete
MNKLKEILKILLLSITILSCSSDGDVDESTKNILVEVIAINGNNIEDGTKTQLTAVIVPTNVTNRAVSWHVSDETVATISNSGLLIALKNGSVKVTVTAQDESGVTVEKTISISGVTGPPVFVNSIAIVGTDITDGNPQQLSVQILPENAKNKTVTWAVSNTAIAEIDAQGLLTPKSNGVITVTATATDGSGKTGQLEINISGATPVYATDLKAENMLLWQRNNGGWPKEPYNDFSGYNREQTEGEKTTALNTKNNTDTTIDNEHTTGELRHLLGAYKTTKNPAYLAAAIKAIDYLFEAQYVNGGWPQYYPDKSGYRHQITFNDNAMVNVMDLMWDISKGKNNTDVLDAIYKDKAVVAFDKGIDVILQTQITINGEKTAWCAQHDEVTLLPALARSYELPSVSGSESVGIVRTLMLVEQPSAQIIQAVKDAVAWFEAVKVVGFATQNTGSDVVVVSSPGNIIWARFYDLDTNLPFFCGRDGVKKNTLAEIELERRTGYAWYGNWPKNLIGSEFTSWKSKNGI